MRMTLLALLALLLVGAAAAAPVPGTCTVTDMASIAKGGAITIAFPISPPVGFQFNVSVDAATGAFTFDRTGWPNHYGYVTVGSTLGFLTLAQDAVTGTIDAAGNVVLPNFSYTTSTDFCQPDECVLQASTTLTTGLAYAVLSGKAYPTLGTPLDFQTGVLELQGSVPWPEAPGGGSVTGLGITCTLSPIPTGLPAAPSLLKPKGKIKIGPALPSTPPTDPKTKVVGDTITFKGTLTTGGLAVDPDYETWIEVSDGAGQDVALFHVAKSALKAKGKTFTAKDADGSAMQVVAGRKKNDAHVAATLGGHLLLKRGKKGITVAFQETGLDLGGLTGPAKVTLLIGGQTAGAPITVSGSKATRKFH